MSIIRWLSVADRHTKMYLDQKLLPLGVNSSQHMYVMKVCEHPGITQDQFMELFYIHPSNIARGLAGLERAGLIRREHNSRDKRTSCLYPTEKGREAYKEILRVTEEAERQLKRGLEEDEAALLQRLLERVSMNTIRMVDKEYGRERNGK